MENETNIEEFSLGKEAAQAFVVTAASTVGIMVGFVAFGAVKVKLDERKARKKNQIEKED